MPPTEERVLGSALLGGSPLVSMCDPQVDRVASSLGATEVGILESETPPGPLESRDTQVMVQLGLDPRTWFLTQGSVLTHLPRLCQLWREVGPAAREVRDGMAPSHFPAFAGALPTAAPVPGDL